MSDVYIFCIHYPLIHPLSINDYPLQGRRGLELYTPWLLVHHRAQFIIFVQNPDVNLQFDIHWIHWSNQL